MRETVITGACVHGNAVHTLPVRAYGELGFNEESLIPKPLWPRSKRASRAKFYQERGTDTGPST